jgi:hypothetical protein
LTEELRICRVPEFFLTSRSTQEAMIFFLSSEMAMEGIQYEVPIIKSQINPNNKVRITRLQKKRFTAENAKNAE